MVFERVFALRLSDSVCKTGDLTKIYYRSISRGSFFDNNVVGDAVSRMKVGEHADRLGYKQPQMAS